MKFENESATHMMALADNMAAAAASFSSHGYDQFISARDEFKSALKELLMQRKQEENLQ